MEGFEVKKIEYTQDIRDFISRSHYSQTAPLFSEYTFGLYQKDTLKGVAIFSQFSRNQAKVLFSGHLELSRVFLVEECPKNSESFFIGSCLRWLKKNTNLVGVISYADPTQGHKGTIYQACNFKLHGKTKASYHYLNQKGERLHKRNIWRKAQKEGISEKQYVERESLIKVGEKQKIRYIYTFKVQEDREVKGDIYLITNLENDIVYVGSSINGYKARFTRHVNDAKNGSLLPLHKAMREIGFDKFKVEKIDEEFTRLALLDKEAYWIDFYKNKGAVYNVSEGFDSESYIIPDHIFLKSLDLRSEGKTLQQISDIFKIHPDYLGRVHSGSVRPHIRETWEKNNKFDFYKFYTDDIKLSFFKLNQEGFTIKEIAGKFECTGNYVRAVLRGIISPKVYTQWVIKNRPPELLPENRLTKKTVFKIYESVFLKGIRPTSFLKDISANSLYKILKGKTYESFFQEWKDLGNPTEYQKNRLVEDEEIWPAFELRASGKKVKDIAKELNLSLTFVNQVLLGKQRPELLSKWISEGGIPLTQSFLGKEANNRLQIKTSDGNIFNSILEASLHYGISTTAIRKGIAKNKPVKGTFFKKKNGGF